MKFTPVVSTNIAEYAYDKKKSELFIRFTNGGLYVYFGVPKDTVNELVNAESIGKYFAQNIKNNYACERR